MKVEVYSTPTCPWCQKVKKFLEENQIQFTEKDVINNRENRLELVKKIKHLAVPVTVIDENYENPIIGFDLKALTEKLKLP